MEPIEYKRWLMMIPAEQYTWLQETAKETNLKGSDILSELIERTMRNRDLNRQFKASLANAQLKVKLQALNDKRAALDEKRSAVDEEVKQLRRQFGEAVPA